MADGTHDPTESEGAARRHASGGHEQWHEGNQQQGPQGGVHETQCREPAACDRKRGVRRQPDPQQAPGQPCVHHSSFCIHHFGTGPSQLQFPVSPVRSVYVPLIPVAVIVPEKLTICLPLSSTTLPVRL